MSFVPASDDPTALPTPAPADGSATSQRLAYPRGLIPPSKRGRSQSQIGDIVVDLGFAQRDDVETAVTVSRQQGRTTGQLLLAHGARRRDREGHAGAHLAGRDRARHQRALVH
jgi:hypothetical protein